MIAAQGLTVNWSLGSEKIVLYTVSFAYSLLSLLFSSLLVVILVVFRFFLCWLIKLSLSQPTGFPFSPFLLPIMPGGWGGVSGAAVRS